MKEKIISLLSAITLHVVLILLLANILIIKPSTRKALFKAKIVSSKDINIQQVTPRRHLEIADETRTAPAKDIVIPEEKPLAIEKEIDLPTLIKTPEAKIARLKDDRLDKELKKTTARSLNFSSKAKITGTGRRIKGKLIFPVSTYSDWNNDQTTIPNLMNEVGRRTNIDVSVDRKPVDFKDKDSLFKYPMIYMNGHMSFSFSRKEVENLHEYLIRGGFLFAVNDVAEGGPFHEAFKREMRKIFSNSRLQRLPMSHPIYHIFYDFEASHLPDALYKNLPPVGYAIYYGDRMVVFYLATGDVCDAWAEAEGPRWPGTYYIPTESHKFKKLSQIGWPEEGRQGAGAEGIENAFQIGVNIVVYALSNM